MKPKGVRNTDKIRIHTQYFEGGMSVDEKVGVPNSYWRAIGFDNRTIPSQLKVFPGFDNISDTLNDLVTAIDQDVSGNRWGIGANGKIFKISTNFSVIDTLDSITGWASNNTLTLNTTNEIEGTGCAQISMAGLWAFSFIQRLNSATVLDLSSDKGTVVFPVYIPTPSSGTFDVVRLRIGSDATFSTNTCRWDVTTQANGLPITYDTWNYFAIDLSTTPTSTTGSPNRSSIISILIGLVNTSNTNFIVNNWLVDRIILNTSSPSVSTIGTLNSKGAAGILYNSVTDQLYIPGQQTVSMYGQLVNTAISGPSQLRLDHFAESASNAPGCTNLFNPTDNFWDGIARDTAAQTYNVPTAISEGAGAFCPFAPDIEPFYSIKVWIVNKGTGDWTLTLHDSQNNVLASVTKTNASLTNGTYNEFKFPAPGVRALVNASQTGISATYHFHLTSTVAGGTVQVVDAGSLNGAKMLLYAYRLVQTNNGWHPTTLFTGSGVPLMCMGNGPYLSTYDFSNDNAPNNQQWQRHALTFRPGEEVCGLTTNNQYLVIAVEKRSTDNTRRFQKGALYFWDGSSYNPNFVIDVPMGAPYSVFTFNNITYFMCAGSLYAWSGGQTVIKVRKIAYQNTDYLGEPDKTIVNPNMMASRYNILMMGYPSSTLSTDIYYGVYSWGAVELTFPNSMVISTGLSNEIEYVTNTNQLQIGCVYNFVDSMYLSWSYFDGTQTIYGLDLIDNNSKPSKVARYESLIFDGGVRFKMKRALRLKINFLDLPTGVTVTPLWKLDRGAWQSVDPVTGQSYTAVAGDNSLMVELNNARFHEIQWGFYVTSDNTATEPAVITGVTMEIDPLVTELNMKRDDD